MMASYIPVAEESRNISFSPLIESDSGQYSCQATKGLTIKSDNVEISVVGKSAYLIVDSNIHILSTELLSHHLKPIEGQHYVLIIS